MARLRPIAAAIVVLAAMASTPSQAVAPSAAVAIDSGRVGAERWKLVAYAKAGERCLDVLFRGNPCRGCGSEVPGGAQVEFRRHSYLQDRELNPYDRPLTFVVVEASRRVERVKLNLVGRRPVSLRVRDPFERHTRPVRLKPSFRFAIARFEGDAVVRSVAAYDREGRFVQRTLDSTK